MVKREQYFVVLVAGWEDHDLPLICRDFSDDSDDNEPFTTFDKQAADSMLALARHLHPGCQYALGSMEVECYE